MLKAMLHPLSTLKVTEQGLGWIKPKDIIGNINFPCVKMIGKHSPGINIKKN